MLGINDPYAGRPKPYRNYAAVQPGDPLFIDLERMGLVKKYRDPSPGYEYAYYQCTEAGEIAAIASHRSIRKPRAARVYWQFLSIRDVCPDLTFREFLTSPEYQELRRTA